MRLYLLQSVEDYAHKNQKRSTAKELRETRRDTE